LRDRHRGAARLGPRAARADLGHDELVAARARGGGRAVARLPAAGRLSAPRTGAGDGRLTRPAMLPREEAAWRSAVAAGDRRRSRGRDASRTASASPTRVASG